MLAALPADTRVRGPAHRLRLQREQVGGREPAVLRCSAQSVTGLLLQGPVYESV